MNRIFQLLLVLLFVPIIQSPRHLFTGASIDLASWTPLGNNVIYSQPHDGTPSGLIRVNADGSNPLQLAGSGGNTLLRWSPDGRQLLYIRIILEMSGGNRIYRHYLHVVNADGSQDQAILDRPGIIVAAEWSPDGSRILVWGNQEFFTIHPDGSNVTAIGDPEGVGEPFLWSPDGSKIAFVGLDGVSLWVMNADGSERERLISRISINAIDWSPDSRWLVLQNSNNEDGTKVTIANVEDRSRTELASQPGYAGGVDWSPDGTKILYGANSDIYVMNTDGSQRTNIGDPEYSELYPQWSPDGRITYIGGPDDGTWEIYVMDANGANPTRLTYNEFDEQTFVWSPDGAYLVYYGHTQHYTSLYAIAASGGTPTLLSANLDTGVYYAVSPNETKIAFTHYTLMERDLYLANLDGSHLSQLTVNEQPDYFVWSPDGQRLALYLDHKGLYVIDANATTVTDTARIATNEMLMSFQWLPDGSQLTFVSNGDIYLVDAGSGNLSRLTTEGIYASPNVAPIGRTLAFFGATPTGLALFAFELDGAGLRKITDVEGETPERVLWSPDGSKIIYASSTMPGLAAKSGEPSADLPQPSPTPYVPYYVINADGSGRRFLTDTDYVIGWTPDGQWIRYGTRLVSADGLTQIEFDSFSHAHGQWSPTSQCLLQAVPDELSLYWNVTLFITCLNLPAPPNP